MAETYSSYVEMGPVVMEYCNNALKSNGFFVLYFGALFFKSIIDSGIGMSGHLFLRGIFWELVCLRVATGEVGNYKENGQNI